MRNLLQNINLYIRSAIKFILRAILIYLILIPVRQAINSRNYCKPTHYPASHNTNTFYAFVSEGFFPSSRNPTSFTQPQNNEYREFLVKDLPTPQLSPSQVFPSPLITFIIVYSFSCFPISLCLLSDIHNLIKVALKPLTVST